ncbi:MAG: hypothetical protein ACYTEQ_00980 [Planctomycetota bacterium]
MSRTSFNPTGPAVLRCDKCDNVFTTAILRRKTCVKCKPVTKPELAKLMSVGGVVVHWANPNRGSQRMVKAWAPVAVHG